MKDFLTTIYTLPVSFTLFHCVSARYRTLFTPLQLVILSYSVILAI